MSITTRTFHRSDEDVAFGIFLGGMLGYVSDPDGDLCLAIRSDNGELSGIADWSWQERSEEQTGQTTQEVADEVAVVIYRAHPGEETFTQVTH